MPGMAEVGAHPGLLQFRGESLNGRYIGTAYIFNRQCGPILHEVSGPVVKTK
jgi:hypothetical protein